jgi:hypothetical protein
LALDLAARIICGLLTSWYHKRPVQYQSNIKSILLGKGEQISRLFVKKLLQTLDISVQELLNTKAT